MSYAEKTDVPVSRSKAEIEALLTKAGATRYATDTDHTHGTALVLFRLQDRDVRLNVPLPKLAAFSHFTRKVVITRKPLLVEETRVERKPEDQRKVHEQACRARWRQIGLLVKAKLEAISIGVSTVEREFLADLYLADGRTVHEALVSKLKPSNGGPLMLGAGGGQ